MIGAGSPQIEYDLKWSCSIWGLFVLRLTDMLSVNECKKYIGTLDLTDKQIEDIRDALYTVVGQVLDCVVQGGIILPDEKN
ncbi:hypothetical protein A2765_06140 [Candidatus Kaiserbacteria bacterium RIFCSPHIGHO2_01_FULL_56_24]|uniref:Uncharacterized protein n=1 Tax=Candidatus Kaiserbacteria bacterium RIFCSPHIGHO2_01_FULL_56_24 TaxID=1798487 RepID=A0A1F6D8N2_9BACT|nr:MAG: hypothetical protein A2765_06140 [Candidatus Kaiserbacteria bacterium RIFCSPHIGHO2_01_FULL_56_24]